LKNFKSLAALDLGNNKFSGIIPSWIQVNNSLLRILRLRSNLFNGSIPWQLSRLSHLHLLDLAENIFTGSIPKSFANFSSMWQPFTIQMERENGIGINTKNMYQNNDTVHIVTKGNDYIFGNIIGWKGHNYISRNSYDTVHIVTEGNDYIFGDVIGWKGRDYISGRIDIVWKGRDYMFQYAADLTAMDLSSNSLSGGIPPELTDLRGLRILNLSRNYLSGSIPEHISNLTLLESLDLSCNKLSGPIPSAMSHLLSLNSFNLSNNNLSGEIPTGNQLNTLVDPSIYSNNPGLCGFPLSIACTNLSNSTTTLDGAKEHRQDLESLLLYYMIIAGVIFGFWLWFGALFFCESQRFVFFSSIDAMQIKVVQKMKHI
jgi:hypothetical protein